MPNLNDIADLAEALQVSPIGITEDYCIAVRNRNAKCTRCADVCPVDAVTVRANVIKIDPSLCTNCGACTTVCPTRALHMLQPTRAEVAGEVASAIEACAAREGCAGTAAIVCARRASKREAEAPLFATVPCLASIDEGLLVQMASSGVSQVLLVDGVCQTCKYRKAIPALDESVRQAELLIEAFGGTTQIERASAFPAAFTGVDAAEEFGRSRRAFFSGAASSAKETVMTAASATVKQQLGVVENRPPIGERLRVSSEGTMPTVPVPYHEALLDALDRIGVPVAETLDARTFATIDIDLDKCNACGMCAIFCPSGALKRNPGKVSSRVEYLEYQTCDCIACGLCSDVCVKKALTLSSEVRLDDIFDFEPHVFNLPEPVSATNKIFGAWR